MSSGSGHQIYEWVGICVDGLLDKSVEEQATAAAAAPVEAEFELVKVLLRRVQFGVIHKLTEDVDRDTGVGVALGVAMPVGVEHDASLVELDAVCGAQLCDRVDPRAVVERQAERVDRPSAVGVTSVSVQQLQLTDGCVGLAGPYSLLLADDECGGGFADR